MDAEQIVKAKWPDARVVYVGQKHCRKYAIASSRKNDYLSGWHKNELAAWSDAATRITKGDSNA